MTTLTLNSATDAQIKQLSRVASDAAEKAVRDYSESASLNKDGAQRVHASGDFAARVREATILALVELSTTDKYKDEEVPSRYGYPSGYARPKPLSEQLSILRGYFPELCGCHVSVPGGELPDGAEGYFAIPRWDRIAPTYGEAVEKVLELFGKAYCGRFYNYRQGQLGPDRFQQSTKSAAAWEKLGSEQTGDIIVVSAQFGIRHRGRSVRRAREVMTASEFGLGAFAVGVMLLTHMDRLQHYNDLWIDCAGDEYHDPQDSCAPFALAPFFHFRDGTLKFGTHWYDYASDNYGSASGWAVPQS